MRNNKGFTLIELLAVIVILAIIAVITVPKVAEMIEDSRKGAANDAFYGVIKAAELGYTKALQSNPSLDGSVCTFASSGVTCTNGVEMAISGTAPTSGKVILDSSGSASVAAGTENADALKINNYICTGTSSTVVSDKTPCTK